MAINFFITSADIKSGKQVVGSRGPLRGHILTPTAMSGSKVKLAETGEWYEHTWLKPLAEAQIREALVQKVLGFAEGKAIVSIQPSGRGVQFVLEDNTRIRLAYSAQDDLRLSVRDSTGKQVL